MKQELKGFIVGLVIAIFIGLWQYQSGKAAKFQAELPYQQQIVALQNQNQIMQQFIGWCVNSDTSGTILREARRVGLIK